VRAADELAAEGISAEVVVVASISPPPLADLTSLVSAHRCAVSVEAHVRTGALGSLVAEVIADSRAGCRLLRLGVDQPYDQRAGSEEFLHELHGLSSSAIAARARSFLDGGA